MSDKLSIIKNIDSDIINIDNNKSINYSSILNNNDDVDNSIAILDHLTCSHLLFLNVDNVV